MVQKNRSKYQLSSPNCLGKGVFQRFSWKSISYIQTQLATKLFVEQPWLHMVTIVDSTELQTALDVC